MRVPERTVGARPPVVVEARTPRYVALGLDGDVPNELVDDCLSFVCGGVVKAAGETLEKLSETAALGRLIVEALCPVGEPRDAVFNLGEFTA